jgi:4,5-dihydroxyphthalate decarboxylase
MPTSSERRGITVAMAVGDYDITRPIIDGTVVPAGVDPIVLTMPSPQRHWRTLRGHEFDVAELSLGSYVAHRAAGLDEFTAIPVFPHRRFRHGYVLVHSGADITRPKDFAGRSVGIRSWQVTAGIWLRGILADDGLALDQVRWVAQDAEDVPVRLPTGIRLDRVPDGLTVTALCDSGDLDGLIYPELPRALDSPDSGLRRLYPDPKAAEITYYRDTGIFPIMHVVVIRSALLARHPWLAGSVRTAFDEAKRLAYTRLTDPRTVSLAWLRALQDEQAAILGPDPWRYGMDDANRHNLATFVGYCAAQGLAPTDLSVDELFYPPALEDPPAFV